LRGGNERIAERRARGSVVNEGESARAARVAMDVPLITTST